MTNIKEHFDVDQIVGVKFFPERPERFIWVEATPEERILFGLIKWRSAVPAGFLNEGYFDQRIYTEDELKGYGYNVYSWDKRIHDRVCNKPYVTVYLSHGLEVSKRFRTDEEAELWIDELKAASGKTFEIINHPKN